MGIGLILSLSWICLSLWQQRMGMGVEISPASWLLNAGVIISLSVGLWREARGRSDDAS